MGVVLQRRSIVRVPHDLTADLGSDSVSREHGAQCRPKGVQVGVSPLIVHQGDLGAFEVCATGAVGHSLREDRTLREGVLWTMVGVLTDSVGEDFNPVTRAPLNGEFSEGPIGPEQGKLIAEYTKWLQPFAEGLQVFRWSDGGTGFEIGRGEIGDVLAEAVGKGKRRKKRTVSLDAPDGPGEAEEHGAAYPSVRMDSLAALRELRERAEVVRPLRDWLDARIDEEELADGQQVDLSLAYDIVDLVIGEPEPAMQAALLHALRGGSRESLAQAFEVTVEKIRYRGDHAQRVLQRFMAS